MDITHKVRLNDDDINAAIISFLNANNVSTEDQDVEIDLTAGRKGQGHYAHITLTPSKVDTAPMETEDIDLDDVIKEVPEEAIEEDSDNDSLFS